MNEQLTELTSTKTTTIEDPIYDFEKLGMKIAESLIFKAEALVTEANSLLDQSKAMAESVRSQVRIQTDALAGLNDRLKDFGTQMLEAHRKFNGGS
jgi:hypothetical protein